MNYLKEITVILAVSFAGEGLHALLPLPVPASIYGIVLMLLLLMTKVIKVDHVKHVSAWLVEIMPVLFIPPAVGLIGIWDVISQRVVQYVAISVVSTLVVMGISGWATQLVIRHSEKRGGAQ